MLFKDVIGQGQVKQHLVEMVQQNRLSHALLFLGKEGSGALPLALAFAQYISCARTGGEQTAGASFFGGPLPADSCGSCASCLKSSQLVHPDIHFTYPVV